MTSSTSAWAGPFPAPRKTASWPPKSRSWRATCSPLTAASLSTGIALQVLEAGERIRAGMPAGEIAKEMQAIVPHCHASFILDTLEVYEGRWPVLQFGGLWGQPAVPKALHRGGQRRRLHARGQEYRGTLKKVLPIRKGQAGPIPSIKRDHLFITYSTIDPSYVELVRQTVEETMEFKEIHTTNASCTIACHCGPNTLGILFETE